MKTINVNITTLYFTVIEVITFVSSVKVYVLVCADAAMAIFQSMKIRQVDLLGCR